MALISLQKVELAFGGPLIFNKLDLQVQSGERIALLGRNGAGKTTLMKVLAGELKPDEGLVHLQKGIRVVYLAQEVSPDIKGSVFDVVLSGFSESVKLLSDYHHLSTRLEKEHTPELMHQLGTLQSELDRTGSWEIHNKVENIIEQMKLDSESDFEKLSGGQKRRTLLIRALISKPDILLLDEPTNHLDIESIKWLEEFLKGFPGTIFFVTHDRMFMTNLATRIIELDRGEICNWECSYKIFLERKQAVLDNEASLWDKFDKKLAQEEIWIRKGVKARRCRDQGRVRALERLREEKKAQRKETGKVRVNLQDAETSGKLVVKAIKTFFSFGDNCLIRDFTTQIVRGDKIGIIGPNGSGKTTLIQILLGQIKPNKGKVIHGTNLTIAYYDQLREQLDEEKTIAQNICGHNDTVTINGKPRHIIGYLQDFLFSPDRARTPVKALSGGERNRLLLARLFTKPFNLLVMDEPTNDLDIETLELLEELLLEYKGTLLLVSHDRSFVNNVVTSTICLEGNGLVNEYIGGYDDYLRQSESNTPLAVSETKVDVIKSAKPKRKTSLTASKKLTFKEKRELEELIPNIEKLEEEQEKLVALFTDVEFYKNSEDITAAKNRLDFLKDEIKRLYERWEYLDIRKNQTLS